MTSRWTILAEDLEQYLDGWSPREPDVFVPRWRGV